MSRLRFIFALLLAVLWLPATLHCAIEEAGLIAADACETVAGDPCAQDHCATVEASHYRAADVMAALPAPVLFVGLDACDLIPPEAIIVPAVSPTRSDCPPEVRCTWQFLARAALPVRAPSAAA